MPAEDTSLHIHLTTAPRRYAARVVADGEASHPALKRGRKGLKSCGSWGSRGEVSWSHVRGHSPALPFNSGDQSAVDVAIATVRLNSLRPEGLGWQFRLRRNRTLVVNPPAGDVRWNQHRQEFAQLGSCCTMLSIVIFRVCGFAVGSAEPLPRPWVPYFNPVRALMTAHEKVAAVVGLGMLML
jgi:hypothetical protein